MAKRKSNVKIENGKVLISQEILDYFENLRTEENSEWINEYFNIISDASNITSCKSRGHHIIPCFQFKDDNHKTREETEFLANQINENIIELSIYNHIKVHYFLWKIFPNSKDAKKAIQHLCRMENLEHLTMEQLDKIAEIEEDCAKKNQTKEERAKKDRIRYQNNRERILKQQKEYGKHHKEQISAKGKKWYNENKERHKLWQKEWNEKHKEEQKEKRKIYWEENRDEFLRKKRVYDSQICLDPIKEKPCTLSALRYRIHSHPDLYKNIIATDCIIKENQQ